MSAKSLRDQIRAATLGQTAEFKKEIVKYNGVDVEIRQPSNKSRKAIMAKSMTEDGKVDFADFMAYAVIENTYVPDTDELVFEATDYDVMLSKPTGGFMDRFGTTTSELMNVEEGEEGKND